MDADPVELRVLGSLIEKQRVTPDVYPLSLNALRLACNQSTNRDPVVALDEGTIRAALERLGRRGWARLASWGGRTQKYRHLLDDALALSPDQSALLCVLMLRGEQTPGELKARTERLHAFADRSAVEAALERLAGRGLVERLPRRPGQKEERYRQLLGGRERGAGVPDDLPAAAAEAAAMPPPAVAEPPAAAGDGLAERVDRLEAEVAELREGLAALRAELGA